MSDKDEDKKDVKPQEDWMTKKWRPMMAIMYMFCCLADFFIFPIMFTVVQFWETQAANDAFRQWVPITLQGGGLFHVAMGAVLGVSAYGRTQEKLNGATGAPSTLPAGLPAQTLPAPVAAQPVAVSSPIVQTQPTYIPPVQEPVAPVVAGFNGKAAPPPAPQPLI
jgi:hypothetical protein